MTINSVTPQEVANHRQVVDQKKVSLASSHGLARKSNDDRKCDLAIIALENQTDEDYYNELEGEY